MNRTIGALQFLKNVALKRIDLPRLPCFVGLFYLYSVIRRLLDWSAEGLLSENKTKFHSFCQQCLVFSRFSSNGDVCWSKLHTNKVCGFDNHIVWQFFENLSTDTPISSNFRCSQMDPAQSLFSLVFFVGVKIKWQVFYWASITKVFPNFSNCLPSVSETSRHFWIR